MRLIKFLFSEKFFRCNFVLDSAMNRRKFNSRGKGVNCNKPLRREHHNTANESGHSLDLRRDTKRSRHPQGLKGKEIGLWYRNRNREQETKPVTISLEQNKIEQIENVLLSVGAVSLKENDKAEDGYFKKKFLKDRSITFEEKLNECKIDVIQPDVDLDEELYKEWNSKSRSETVKKMLEFRHTLPVFKKRKEIIDAIDKNQIVVISGETGCGKTTQVVQFVLDDYIHNKKGSLFKAVCTQPRRISAISVAERVATERGERLGTSVGYVIRLENELPSRKRGTVTFVTTGILIQWLQSNPLIDDVSHLFIDEIHERDTLSDFLLALLKYILPKRPNLRVVLMSATLNSEKFSEYFGGVPSIHIPGFTYAVEEIYLEDILQMFPFRFFEPKGRGKRNIDPTFLNYVVPYVNNLERSNMISKEVARELKNPESEALNIDLIFDVIYHICTHEVEGAILVFVPGLAQIQDLHRKLSGHRYFSSSSAIIIPMHSIMPTSNQKTAFSKPPKGVRKIIISTTICETSITIDDVRFVVDCGKNKMQNFDLNKNVRTLEPEWETLANARQRKGRAGRTLPGKCYKLFTKAREETFELFPVPDIQRCRLEEVILNAKTLKLGKVGPFFEKLIDPPAPKAVELSLKMLTTLNLLDGDEKLTPLGYHVAKLPLDPQTGKMILMGALFSCLDPILSIAACLNFKDPFEFVFGREKQVCEKRSELSLGEKSDHIMLSNALISWENARNERQDHKFSFKNFLSQHNLQFLSNMKKQFAGYLYDMKFAVSSNPKDPRSNVNSQNISLIKAIVCSGLYPNVAVIKKIIKNRATGVSKKIIWKTIDHPKVEFHLKSVLDSVKNFESPYVVYFEKIKSSAIFLHDATMVHPMPLVFFGEKCDVVKDSGYYIRVDDMIKFSCTKRTATLIQELREQLIWILQQAVLNPGVIDWHKQNQKTLILKSIVDLITSEDVPALDEFDIDFQKE